MSATERIQRLLEPAFSGALDRHSLDELRARKAECADVEHAVSYYRRLAQARIEILDAEQARRARGGELSELVADLPRILGSDAGRSGATGARIAPPDAPAVELRWDDGREALVADLTLANLGTLDDAALDDTRDRLRAFERELSEVRRRLHGVIERFEREIATRQVAGAP